MLFCALRFPSSLLFSYLELARDPNKLAIT
jgi:hypothetical protein